MFQKIKRMWQAFLSGARAVRDEFLGKKIDVASQDYIDIVDTNFLAIATTKLSNLACTEATFDVESDSTLAEPLKDLCKDIEANRFEIAESMLGKGDYYAVPSFDESGNLYHSYIDSSRVKIIETNSKGITKAYIVIDFYQKNNFTKEFYLLRYHELQPNGTLNISYRIVDGDGKETSLDYEPWNNLQDISFVGAESIGFGRYKSPVSSRGLSTVYGVPMNFGCSKIERDIFDTLKLIVAEGMNGKSVIMTDPRNLKFEKDEYGNVTKIKGMDNIIPIRKNAGDTGTYIDIYNPSLRFSAYYEELQNQLALYEQQMGLSKGIFTENTMTHMASATEVRRTNSDTIAFINAVRTALDNGNKETLKADCVYLNIRPDLWEYVSDWYDPFADSQEQWQTLVSGFDKGAVTVERLTKWLYPNMTEEQVQAEIEAVKEYRNAETNNALKSALMM